jgi:hypothetical protein
MQCDNCNFKKKNGCLATKSRKKKKENLELAKRNECKSYQPDFFTFWDKTIRSLKFRRD